MKPIRKNLRKVSNDGISTNWRPPVTQYNTREFYNDLPSDINRKLPLWVEFVHKEHCYDKYYRMREKSEVFSIEFVLKGSMHFAQEGREYQVNPGEVFLVHLDRTNEFYLGPEKHCNRMACSIKGHCLNSILQTTGLYEKDVITLNDADNFENLMLECFQTMKNRPPDFRKHASALAYQLLLELENSIMRENRPDLVLQAIEIMETHLSEHFSLNSLAELLKTSRSSLNRVFQATFQESPINYFIIIKMNAAQSMLTNTSLQIQEIASRVGYNNPLYFSTEFRKRTGLSPRQFRKQNQQES